MGTIRIDDFGDCIEDHSNEQLISSERSDMYNVFEDPEISPRVGDQYQVEVPSLITEYAWCWLSVNSVETESRAVHPHELVMGLPIPIVLIGSKTENIEHETGRSAYNTIEVLGKPKCADQHGIMESEIIKYCDKISTEVEYKDSTLVGGQKLGEAENLREQQEMDMISQGHSLVPGSLTDSWNDMEVSSFVLGLYIFGKNLVQVKQFVGSKSMGDILSYYYGKFYRSDKYRRWAETRNIKSRKCMNGQKIFSGVRQQELLSRLVSNVSEKCRETILEVSKTYGDGKILLEEYVMNLKASVGLKVLVEAVGIGKGKQDLTGTSMESLKSTHVHPARPELPAGKACSALTPLEIIKFLTGDFRLSKARSHDLFWEAVWPRLLARGWQSVQPDDYCYAAGSKNSLVFLVPGVKKFSRRKLGKGNHYFDSVTDVLRKVASEPGLLELENGSDNGCNGREGNGWIDDTKLEHQNSPDQQRHCYLKPRTPSRSNDVMKFTVVDTSLASRKTFKVRELRSLPDGVFRGSPSERHSEDDDYSTEKSDSANMMCFNNETEISKPENIKIDEVVSSDKNASEKGNVASSDNAINPSVVLSSEQKIKISRDTLPANVAEAISSQRMAPSTNGLVPVTKKRRRLNHCNQAENLDCATVNISVPIQEGAVCTSDPSVAKKVLIQTDTQQGNKTSVTYPQEASHIITMDSLPRSNSICIRHEEEKPARALIDLNIPVSPEAEADEPFMPEMAEGHHGKTGKESDDAMDVTAATADNSLNHPNMQSRRQSTRNRPPTTKFLESFGYGFMEKKEKRKKYVFLDEKPPSKSSRRARPKVRVGGSRIGGPDRNKDETGNGACKGCEHDPTKYASLNEG